MIENSVALDNQTLENHNKEDTQYLKPEQDVKRKVHQTLVSLSFSN